jgi:hypothetical protein
MGLAIAVRSELNGWHRESADDGGRIKTIATASRANISLRLG